MDQRFGHILIASLPLQGHTGPLIRLLHKLANYGLKMTFMVTESMAPRIASSVGDQIKLVSFPDGLESNDDRKDIRKLSESINRSLPRHLQDFLDKANGSRDIADRVTGVIFDSTLASLLDIPRKMGIKTAIYWCSSPGCMALLFRIPKLVESNIVDMDGYPLKNEKISLLPDMPAMSFTEFPWYFPGDLDIQKSMFHFLQTLPSQLKSSDWIICNWIHELDTSASGIAPNILSVGPLLANERSSGSLYSEDSSCLSWLDQQPPGSVVYIAFGSTSKFSQLQINEIAMGLELVNRPFLWVAWSGLVDGSSLTYPDGFSDRVANRGTMVEWAPQEKVLGHPSVACFVSHCGWNSTIESISNGVPLLCWPYFGDQLYNQTCICEAWKVGLSLNADENGVVSRCEMKQKIGDLLSDTSIKTNTMNLKEMARKSIGKGGSSYRNIEFFVTQMKH